MHIGVGEVTSHLKTNWEMSLGTYSPKGNSLLISIFSRNRRGREREREGKSHVVGRLINTQGCKNLPFDDFTLTVRFHSLRIRDFIRFGARLCYYYQSTCTTNLCELSRDCMKEITSSELSAMLTFSIILSIRIALTAATTCKIKLF